MCKPKEETWKEKKSECILLIPKLHTRPHTRTTRMPSFRRDITHSHMPQKGEEEKKKKKIEIVE